MCEPYYSITEYDASEYIFSYIAGMIHNWVITWIFYAVQVWVMQCSQIKYQNI